MSMHLNIMPYSKTARTNKKDKMAKFKILDVNILIAKINQSEFDRISKHD